MIGIGEMVTRVGAASSLLLFAALCGAQSVQMQPGSEYVALGSSFAAGPGIAEQQATCGRSDHNYAHLVAAELGLALTDVSCGGATTDHILNSKQGEAAPQLEALTSTAKLVTLTIGGNDIRYSRSTGTCSGAKTEDRCAAQLDQAAIAQAIEQLPSKLGQVLDAIHAKAPSATVVVVPYPRVIPPQGQRCEALGLTDEDANYLATMGEALESALVEAASNHKALLADPYPVSANHGPCAVLAERWINGAKVELSGATFHPTALAHEVMAELVIAALSAGK